MIHGQGNGHRSSELLTVGQVASWLNVHPNTVRRWVASGALSAYRIGSRGDRRIRRDEVEMLLERKPGAARSSLDAAVGTESVHVA